MKMKRAVIIPAMSLIYFTVWTRMERINFTEVKAQKVVDARTGPMIQSAHTNISKPSPCLASEDLSDSCCIHKYEINSKNMFESLVSQDEHKKIGELENSAYAVLTYWELRKCAPETVKKPKKTRRVLFPIN